MNERLKKLSSRKGMDSLGPIGILLVIVAILFATTPSFRSANNLTQILLSASVYYDAFDGNDFRHHHRRYRSFFGLYCRVSWWRNLYTDVEAGFAAWNRATRRRFDRRTVWVY